MKIIIILLFIFLTITAKAQVNHASQLANKIAQKMADSLGLTPVQKANLVTINMNLQVQKKSARRDNPGSSAAMYVQKIENKRDSLYKEVLPADKYLLYKQKKRNLVNNN